MVRLVFSEMAETGLAKILPEASRRTGFRDSLKYYLRKNLTSKRQVLEGSGRLIWAIAYWNRVRVVWEVDGDVIRIWHIGNLAPDDPDRF